MPFIMYTSHVEATCRSEACLSPVHLGVGFDEGTAIATGFLKGLSVLTVSILLAVLLHTDSRADGQPDAAARAKAIQLFSAAPAAFIENTGQVDDPSIRYSFHGSGANVFHTTSGPVFHLCLPTRRGTR